MDNCSGYTVEENELYCSCTYTLPSSSFPKGIYVYNSGTAENIIYRNSFSRLGYANFVVNINGDTTLNGTGLQFQCNDFYKNYLDIYAHQKAVMRPSQGNSAEGADNNFLLNNTNTVNIYSQSFYTLHYYYSNGETQHIPVISSYVTSHSGAVANACSSTICYNSGGGVSKSSSENELTSYDILLNEYNNALATFYAQGYDQVLNGISTNNADNFAVNAVNTSDDIAGSAALIQQARDQQNLLLSLSRQMADISDFNIRNLLTDSLLLFPSLEEWFSRVNTPVAKYSLVGNYYHAGDYAQAEATLQNIPNLFDFDDSETAEYNNFVAFYNFKNNIRLSGRNLAQLTEDEIAELEIIATNTDGLSAAMAKGVLCFFYNICFENEIPEEVSSRNLFQNNAEDETELSVVVYPNPTENQLNILFSASLTESAEMQIFDITGRCVQSGKLTNSFSTISMDNLTSGIYFYRIIYKENIIARDKLVKQ